MSRTMAGLAVAALAGSLLAGCGATSPLTAISPGTGSAASSSPTAGSSALATAPPGTSTSSPSTVPVATTPAATAVPAGIAILPVVPVVDFRSPETSVRAADVRAALSGGGRYGALELVEGDADAILAALGVPRPADPTRLVLAPDADALARDLAAHRDRLAFLCASEVGPSVRALGWGGRQLFGVDRVRSLAGWPLTAELAPDAVPFDPAATWTLWAGGDLGFDRTVAYVVTYQHKGVDYPYDGGTARIAGLVCCSPFGWKVPTVVRTGHAGAMRDLISSADLALANMEEPTPDHFTFHRHGTVFTGNPALLAGVSRAGIDVVSLATTHIGDGGRSGILETMRSLDKYGIAHFGAGRNLAAARRPAVFEIGGVKVAILGYDSISAKWYGATATTIGSAPLTAASVRADVAAARKAGAAVVIVYPHWGVEYTSGPSAFQRRLAHAMIDAGADIVIGNHPHWVQVMEVYKGRPIWYALGNFTFDQTWSEPTLEGISLELTFSGATLVQASIHPHVLVLGVQPNLLDPAGDGQRVLGPMYKASAKLLPW